MQRGEPEGKWSDSPAMRQRRVFETQLCLSPSSLHESRSGVLRQALEQMCIQQDPDHEGRCGDGKQSERSEAFSNVAGHTWEQGWSGPRPPVPVREALPKSPIELVCHMGTQLGRAKAARASV